MGLDRSALVLEEEELKAKIYGRIHGSQQVQTHRYVEVHRHTRAALQKDLHRHAEVHIFIGFNRSGCFVE